jgi:hypothetical protein
MIATSSSKIVQSKVKELCAMEKSLVQQWDAFLLEKITHLLSSLFGILSMQSIEKR